MQITSKSREGDSPTFCPRFVSQTTTTTPNPRLLCRSTGTLRWQRRLFITFSRSPLSGFCTRWWHGGCTWAPERCLANWWVECNYNIVAAGHSYSVMVNISTYSLCRVNRREPGDMWHEWWLPLSSVSIQLIYGNAIFNYVLRVVRRESLSWMEKNDQILW